MSRPRTKAVSNGAAGVPLAVIYTRVSSDDQANEGTSLAAQLSGCRRYVADRGWVIHAEYTDVMTGRRDDRPHYQALLTQVRELRGAQRPVVVVVAALDRFGRRMVERVRSREELKLLGVATHSIREGGEVSDLTANILASVAQEEVDRLGARIRGAWSELGQKGWFKVSPFLPWGYRSRPATAAERADGAPMTVIEPDPAAAPAVRECFQLAARGSSAREIARWTQTLSAEVRGARYADVRGGMLGEARERRTDERVAQVHMIKHVLRNNVYAARLDVNVGTKSDPDWREFAGKWQPIVDDDTWQAVQRRLDAHRDAPRAAPDRFVLTGLVTCPSCGQSMQGETLTVGAGRIRRYRCAGSRRSDVSSCNQTARADQVEALVLGEVGSLVELISTNSEIETRLKQAWAKLAAPDADQSQSREVRRLEQRSETARRRINDATRLFVDGRITKDAYDGMCDEERKELEVADAELSRLRAVKQRPAVILPGLESVLASAGSWSDILTGTDLIAQRDVLSALLERVVPVRMSRGVYRVDITWTPLGEALRAISQR